MMSLNPIPGVGKSASDPAQVAPEEKLRELLGEAGERLQVLHPGLASLGIARAKGRSHKLLDHACLLARGRPEAAEHARGDPEARELGARRSDLDVALAVALVLAAAARVEQAELLELARELLPHSRAFAHVGERQFLFFREPDLLPPAADARR
jgi:hypothetical protein